MSNLCPRCHKGRVFDGFVRMNRSCPSCGLKFERESGYFLGAMIVSYFVGAFSLIPTAAFLILGLKTGLLESILILTAQVLLLSPLLFRYSRLAWLNIDQSADPGDHH